MQAHQQIQRNTEKAYFALQNYQSSAGNIPLPDVVNTDRDKLSREQIAAKYLKSVEGNPDIDINKQATQHADEQPRMVPKPTQSLDFFGPINDGISKFCKTVDKTLAGIGPMLVKRGVSADQQQSGPCYPTPSMAWLQVKSDDFHISVQLSGDLSPGSTCIGDAPIFIDANPGQASMLLPSGRGYPNTVKVLDFTGSSMVAAKCKENNSMDCIAPQAGDEAMITQIDQLLNETKDAYIYLTKESMDKWLASKQTGNTSNTLNYVRLSDDTSDKYKQRPVLGGTIAAGLLGGGLLVAGGVYVIRRLFGERNSASMTSAQAPAAGTVTPEEKASVASSSEEV